ncbi:MAG: nicotinic acid mononucleotide adenylyltransferase [SAR86 cluster bacterium]|uniref:Probable nicotinate-nucleotide adenylyltransferase n=1 Tax=SAR86 cluster bacterium TaxID=2030880 RepID=A0A2A4XBJ2_9GAMM|nr:MAG: nicotinic acid mononucleotide adenylyltransferase [SAR86 cluster bacterium]
MSSPLAVLGGLFDPVHKGHVSAARFALEFLSTQRLKMIPCHLPNHKPEPNTQAEHRLAMLELATASYPQIEVDPIELQRDRVSYTVDTLTELRKRHGMLVFVLGVDSFNSLPEWHDWQKILDLSHLLVLSRQGATLSDETLSAVDIKHRRVDTSEQLLSSPNGKIIYCENFDYDMASSEIRKKITRGDEVSAELDAKVVQYIRDNCLYQN